LYRALKILTEREVSPQIGLLKSTLLQLDSTFSEKDYGASSFRDFVEKLARKGIIRLKHMDRSILVEPLEDGSGDMSEDAESDPASENGSPAEATAPAAPERGSASPERAPASPERAPASPERMEEGATRIREAFEKAESIKWPMYMRSVKQLIRSFDSEFEESDYGFRGLQDALRHVQKSGWLRLDRNRRGVLRVLPGDALLEARGESAAPLGQREEPAAEKVSKRYTPEEEAAAQMAEAAKRSRQDEDEDSAEAVGDAAAEPEETRGPDEPAGDMPDGDDEASEETKPARKKAARKTTRKKAAATKTRARKTTGTRRKTAAKAPKAAKEADAE
jgi:hypothetical protein